MNLKTYRAPSMAQALSEVKKDLGKDAVILHTRAYKVGSVLGIGGKQVVEITAADQMSARGPRIREQKPPQPTQPQRPDPAEFIAEAFTKVEAPAAVGETPTVNVRPVKIEDLAPRPRPAAPKAETNRNDEVPPPPPESSNVGAALLEQVYPPPPNPAKVNISRLTTKVPFAPVSDSALLELQVELASIKRLVGQVLSCTRTTAASVSPMTGMGNINGVSDPLFNLYLRLQDGQVSPAIAEELVGKVRDELTPDELGDPEIVRQSMLRQIAAMMPVVGSVSRAGRSETGRPLTIALVGPTGVGKTTTIAKLAAAYKLRQGKKVGLITSDTYRIAAVDQLRTYANIIGLPLKVVMTPREMAAACSAFADCDAVLIDTAGRSQHDAGRLEELSAFIEACSPDETHLVLSATGSEAVLDRAVKKFDVLRPSRVIFSKLDEAVNFGVLLNILRGSRLRVSYLTTGQEVPDQIELAQADRLARLVLDGELVS
jgi:flagellar biosynthesis protein FlhF